MSGLRVLSLFDGLAGGRIALERAGIPVETYYASEIDLYAQSVARKNYPDIKFIGDVNFVNWEDYIGKVDMIIGGSPCTQLSICGDRTGLEGDASKLFFKMVEAIEVIKPKYYFLENVASMTDENRDIMTSYMKVEPLMIDSALLSSQQRKRYYWFNWDAPMPENKHISVEDILDLSYTVEKKRADITWTREDLTEKSDKLEQIGHFGNGSQGLRIYSVKGKGNTLGTGGSNQENYLVTLPNGKQIIRQLSTLELERQQTLPDGYTKLAGIPDRERRKMIGNGWTIDVITHLFKQINS